MAANYHRYPTAFSITAGSIEHIITADPIHDMATMIRKINPDIAVFGAFGKSMDNEENIDYSKIGSVAENALKVSKVPVILVK
jgi:nucleotide-binding universal stress UspA family protein